MKRAYLLVCYSIVLSFLSFIFINDAFSETRSFVSSNPTVHQYQKYELAFNGELNYSNPNAANWKDPFDYKNNQVWIELSYCHYANCLPYLKPDNVTPMRFPAYFDGDYNLDRKNWSFAWKFKLNLNLPGTWKYVVHNSMNDRSLENITGYIDVLEPLYNNELNVHGYPIRFKPDTKSNVLQHDGILTYRDGTPFKWLADSWSVFPQGFEEPFLSDLINKRVAQGFTAIRTHGWNRFFKINNKKINALQTMQNFSAETFMYWDDFESKLAKVTDAGLYVWLGFGGKDHFDARECYDANGKGYLPGESGYREGCFEEGIKRLFMYSLARFGAQPVSYLLLQEYNYIPGTNNIANLPTQRVNLINEIGNLIEQNDPYNRAKALHFATSDAAKFINSNGKIEYYNPAENWPWVDFYLLQAGHRIKPKLFRSSKYKMLYDSSMNAKPYTKPFIEFELNYEGGQMGYVRNEVTGLCNSPRQRKTYWHYLEDADWKASHCSLLGEDPLDDEEWLTDANIVAETTIDSMQFGSRGLSYGAMGLYNAVNGAGAVDYYNGIIDKNTWGPIYTKYQAYDLKGPEYLDRVQTAYEQISWWKLKPVEQNQINSNLLKPMSSSRAPGSSLHNTKVYGYGGAQEAYKIELPQGIPSDFKQQVIVDIHNARYSVVVYQSDATFSNRTKLAEIELNSSMPECSDGKDNDNDGLVDTKDSISCINGIDDSENSTGASYMARITMPIPAGQVFNNLKNIVLEVVRNDASVAGYRGSDEGYMVHYPSGGRQLGVDSSGNMPDNLKLPLKVEKANTEYEVVGFQPSSDNLWQNKITLLSNSLAELKLPRPQVDKYKEDFLLVVKRIN